MGEIEQNSHSLLVKDQSQSKQNLVHVSQQGAKLEVVRIYEKRHSIVRTNKLHEAYFWANWVR